MSAYCKSLYISAGHGELQYTGVKTVDASTKTRSSLCHCMRMAVAGPTVSSQRMPQGQVMLVWAQLINVTFLHKF